MVNKIVRIEENVVEKMKARKAELLIGSYSKLIQHLLMNESKAGKRNEVRYFPKKVKSFLLMEKEFEVEMNSDTYLTNEEEHYKTAEKIHISEMRKSVEQRIIGELKEKGELNV